VAPPEAAAPKIITRFLTAEKKADMPPEVIDAESDALNKDAAPAPDGVSKDKVTVSKPVSEKNDDKPEKCVNKTSLHETYPRPSSLTRAAGQKNKEGDLDEILSEEII
jgi:hypothetical protein